MYVRISSLVGQEVTFTPAHGDTHHGIVRSATFSMSGETVIVVHLDDNPIANHGDMVLIGPDADAVRRSLTERLSAA